MVGSIPTVGATFILCQTKNLEIMSTRSSIAIQHSDVEIESVYCHSDGYLEGVGTTLLNSYTMESRVKDLLKHGDISSLGYKLSPTEYDHSFATPEKGTTVFYGRDRGDKNIKSQIHFGIPDFIDARTSEHCEYLYLWSKGEWFVYRTALPTLGFVPLTTAKTY